MSLLVGADDTQPSIEHAVGGSKVRETTHRWVTFGFAKGEGPAEPDHDSERYWLESVEMRRGRPPAEFTRGATVIRREMGSVQPTAAAGLIGVTTEIRRSSSEDEERALLRTWGESPWRVALVVTISHAPAFWALPRAERAATYLGFHEEPRSHRPKVLGRVIRRLYRARAAGAEWDYLAYFEMQPTDVAHVRDYLEVVRRRSNPLFAHVEREVDLWMVKDVARELATGRSGS